MANTKFQLKRSVVPGKIPASGDLDIGELALNLSDAKIFSKHSLGNIITLSDYEMANSANIIARESYSQANTATTIGQSAFAQANSAISNTVLIQSVDATQNTNITSAFTQANNAISNTVLIQSVDATQNTNINSAFTQANNAISNTVLIWSVDATQNTNITAAFTQANTANINAANASYLSTGTVSVSLLGSGTANANTYLRGDGSWAYVSVSGGGGASVTIANTAPATPTAGNLWWDSSDGEGTLRIYYTDIDSSQWVDAIPNPSVVQNQIALTTAYSAFDRANGAFSQANGAYAQANGAFAQANGAVQKTSSNGSAIIPVGMTSQRDVSPSVGYFRYNSNTSSFEGYTTSGWGSIGGSVPVRQTFIASANQTSFTITGGYSAGLVDVFLNGAKLLNGTDVNISSGTSVVLNLPAIANSIVDVVGLNSTSLSNVVPITGGNMTGGLNVNGTFTSGNTLPITNNTYNLGSPSYRWANLYTADMHFSNEGTVGNIIDGTTGNWTLQEGEDNIFMINNKTGKRYKIKLEEV